MFGEPVIFNGQILKFFIMKIGSCLQCSNEQTEIVKKGAAIISYGKYTDHDHKQPVNQIEP